MDAAILTQQIVNACQDDALLATKELPERRSTLFIKVSGRIRSDAFKRTAFSFTVIKQLSTTIKTFHYYGTGV